MNIALENNLIEEIKRETHSNDVVKGVNELLEKYKIYKQTKKVAEDINLALKEVKENKIYDLKSVLDEI